MAIPLTHFRLFLRQRADYELGTKGGRALALGVQDVNMTHEGIASALREVGVEPVEIPAADRRYTVSQQVSREQSYAHVADLFYMVGYTEVDTLDFSDAEGADILHDLNTEIPEELAGRYDLIYDGGVIEHVLDINQGLRNCCQLLRPGGCILHSVPLFGWHTMCHFNIQPSLFFEFYLANGFTKPSAYLNYFPVYREEEHRPLLYREYLEGDDVNFTRFGYQTVLLFYATKETTPEQYKKPVQEFYRSYHGENGTASDVPANDPVVDGRFLARVKRALPAGLSAPLVAIKRAAIGVGNRILPYRIRGCLWSLHLRRYRAGLDRSRSRKVFKI
jgi:SAM-dependent methyltransferase